MASKLIGRRVDIKNTGDWGFIKAQTDDGYYLVGGGSISLDGDKLRYREFAREEFVVRKGAK
jgi:hypothetical protein